MKIYNPSGEVLIETVVSDRSGLYKSIDNREELTLQFSLDRHVDIPVGSWCNFEDARYEVMSLPDVKMINTKNYSYTVVLASNFSKTAMYIVRNPVDGRIKFDLTAKPIEHLRLIVDNLNQREGGWSVGSCIESVEKLVSYNQVGCDMALVNIADVFETEVEVKGKVISLGKVEYFKNSPLALSYGKGKGFKTGILRTGDNGGLPTHKVFVIGGSRNISLKDYGSKELHLPVELSFGFDGEFFDGEVGYSYLKAKPFVTDKKGSYVMIDDNKTSGKEDCIDLSDVYPSRVGKVTGVVYVYQGKDYETLDPSWTEEQLNEVQVDFIDDTIPDNLDYNECLIENGEPLTVIFQTGMLAGREFSATYVSDKKRFELQKQEFDGLPMPQGAFIPSVPDSYAVFNVSMPSTYISDPSTYSGAEFDILREASRVLYESSSLKFSFTGELDGIWAKKNWEKVSPRIRIGSYVSFVHEKMFPDEPAVVRIVGITQYVNNPHSPKIEISNSIGSSSLSSRISALENNGAHVEELFEESKRYTKRRFSDVKHTIEMLAGAFENFSDGIDPVTVETMLAAIGDESLQYVFTRSLESDDPADFSYSYDEKTKVFSVPDAFIKHMTLGIDSISPVHSEDEYMRWAVSGVTSEALADKDKGYYLYAVVKKNSTTGEFKLLESPVMLEEVDGYYHLLVGILNKEFADSRSFACLFGFTEILPGQIVTESIRSSDGKTWLDLLRGILHLNDMAGVSGVKTDSKGDKSIAAWFGGLMQDKELDDDATNPAKSVIRHDGTGYFADGLFKWDKDNGVNLGNDSIKINYDGSVEFGPNIKISTEGDETLGSVLTLIAELKDMFYKYDEDTIGTKYSFFSEKQSAAGGIGEESGGGGGGIGTITGIVVNGKTYNEPDNMGLLTLPDYPTSLLWSDIEGRPTALSAFSNDVGYIKEVTTSMLVEATGASYNVGKVLLSTGGGFGWTSMSEPDWDASRGNKNYIANRPFWATWKYNGSNISVSNSETALQSACTTGSYDILVATVKYAGHTQSVYGTLGQIDATLTFNLSSGGKITFRKSYSTLYVSSPSSGVIIESLKITVLENVARLPEMYIPTTIARTESIQTWAEERYLKLSGGAITGNIKIESGVDRKIILDNTDTDNKYQFISFRQNGTEYGQLGTAGSDDLMWGTEGYEKIILHSGNIGSYKAGSATKLESARTIWGQSFDGTGNVSGSIYGGSKAFSIYGYDDSGNTNIIDCSGVNKKLWVGYGSAPKSYDTELAGYNINFHYGTSRTTGLILNSSGNVTIGSSDLAGTDYKLYVNGKIFAKEQIYACVGFILRTTDGKGIRSSLSYASDTFYIQSGSNDGSSTAGKMMLSGINTQNLSSFDVRATKSLFNGNVGIGTSDPQYKLDVNGNGRYKGNLHLCTSSEAGSYGKYLGFGYHGARIVSDNSNFAESFRTTMFGNSSAGTRFITFRTDTTVDGLCEIYGNGIAWASGDTHGYLAVSYGSYKAYIGGGSSDKLSWYAQLFHSQMSIIPATDKTHNIGSAAYRYANAYLSNSVRIGNAILSWDSANNALKIEGNVYATGQVASGGIGEEGDNIATYDKWGGLKPAYSTTGKATLTTASASFTNNPTIAARTTIEGRYYAVEMDSVGRAFVNVPWIDTNYWTLDASVSRIYPKDAARQLCVGGAGNSAYSTSLYKLVVHGSAFAISGTWQSSSDMTMKDVVRDIDLDIKDIANAPSFAFRWKGGEDKTEWLGTSAQYWKAILPTAVKGDDGSYSLCYGELALTTAIAIAKKTMNHEERINELERQITTLKRKLSVYEN